MTTTLRIIFAALVAALYTSNTVNAGVFSTPAAQMGATYNPGTIPIGVPAISVTNAPTTFFSFNPTGGYNYSTDGSTNPAAGFFPDYHFLGSAGITPGSASSPIWTFSASASDYYLYPTIDHAPLPNEALESSLWGSNDGGSTWSLGKVVEVYEQGWNSSGLPDDGATRWQFSTPVNMISAVVGLTQGVVGSPLPPYSYGDGDFEVDAVMQAIPEPQTYAMFIAGLGLLGFAWQRKRLTA